MPLLPSPLLQAPGLGVARSVNVSVHFGAAMRAGSPVIERTAYIADATGNNPYLFQLYPEVTSVSPSDGSQAGEWGQIGQVLGGMG